MVRRFCAVCVFALLLVAGPGGALRGQEPSSPSSLVAVSDPLPAEEELKQFHLPAGFEIQLVACEPEIHKPMNMNFDARGRLYVTSSLEYPFAAQEGESPRDALQVLSDLDGDGRADNVTRLVEGLNIPIGVTPVPGGVVYYSIPSIHRLEDVDDDGRIETHHVLYGRFGHADTHGMANSFTRWIDGWIYACHGYANTSEVRGADGSKITMHSGNTFRMRADGSHVEQFTHGQVNPFGLSFDPLGNVFSADCHTMPVYQLLRGAWYPSFGKPHDGLGFGPTMIEHNHGSTGIAGVVYYAADHFPPEYRDALFIGNPVTGRVHYDRLEVHGSTFKAIEQPDFITCDDPWFRPVDLKLGPDGALYIADFYNRIIGHYEVPLTHPGRDRHRGRIWRVVYAGADGRAPPPRRMPDLAELPPARLVEFLGDPNLTVRVLATEQLLYQRALVFTGVLAGKREKGEVGGWRRAHALWLYERLVAGGLEETLVERLANDTDRLVRVHLVKALAERRRWKSSRLSLADLVRGKLADPDAFVRRAAADALGRHPQVENVEPLLALWAATPAEDTHLLHVVRMALGDHLGQPRMYSKLPTRVAAHPAQAARLADVSLGVHSTGSAKFLLGYLMNHPVERNQQGTYVHEVARFLPADKLPELYAWCQTRAGAAWPQERDLVLALHRAAQERGQAVPNDITAWAVRLARELLADDQPPAVGGGIELARELLLDELHDELAALASAESRFADLRPAAIDACVANDPERSVGLLSRIIGNAAEPMSLRQNAAAALANVNQPSARDELAAHLPTAPERLAIEIAAGLALQPEGGELLLGQVAAGKASPRILQEMVVRERLRAAHVPGLERRLAQLTADLPPADERARQLIEARRAAFFEAQADPDPGQKVFEKACAACHRLAGRGAKIGPDLDGVGLRGLDRLLEDLLDPSRNVDQAFQSTVLATVDGRSISGLLLREEGEVLVLADAQGKEVRVPAADIDQRATSPLSPMPGNVADLVPEADFFHMLAFLLEQRQAADRDQP